MVDSKLSELPLFGTSIDKSQVPPIHQKRIIAFVNTFTLQTVEFLNNFAGKCENQLLGLEMKLNRVDTQLQLIEAKLNSIPDIHVETVNSPEKPLTETPVHQESSMLASSQVEEKTETEISHTPEPAPVEVESPQGVKAKEDYRYKKYFKMIQFGVPVPGVKQKMAAEGIDPDLLDTPDKILLDGVSEAPPQEDSDESD